MRLLALVIIFLVLLGPIALAAPIESESGKTNGAAWVWDELWKQREAAVGPDGAKFLIRALEKTSMFNFGSSLVRPFNPDLADQMTATGLSLTLGLDVNIKNGTAGMSIGDMLLNMAVMAGAVGAGAVGRGTSLFSRSFRLGRFTIKIPGLGKPITQAAVRSAVAKELAELGVKAEVSIEARGLPWGTYGEALIEKGAPKLIRLDPGQIGLMSKLLDKPVLKYVARHEATHAAIYASRGYLRGFGKFSKSAQKLIGNPINKAVQEAFTDILTTARYQGNMHYIRVLGKASKPFTVTKILIENLKKVPKMLKEAGISSKAINSKAIGTFANQVQKFANKMKGAGKVLPSIVSAPAIPKLKSKFKKYKTAKKRSIFKNMFKKKYKTVKKYKSVKKYKTKKRSIFKNIFKKKYKKYKKYKRVKKYKKRSWKRRGRR